MNEYKSFAELRTEFPEINQWVVTYVQSKMPQINAINAPKSIDNINTHWDKKIEQKTPESWEDIKNPTYRVVTSKNVTK